MFESSGNSVAIGKTDLEKDLHNAFDELMRSPKLNDEAKSALSVSEGLFDEYYKTEHNFVDGVLANAPPELRDAYNETVLKDRADELKALQSNKLEPLDPKNRIDRKLGICLSSGELPVVCLADAASNWQILKNQEIAYMQSNWNPDAAAKLAEVNQSWQKFAQAEDNFLSIAFPDDGPEDSGPNRLKAEINVGKDRAMQLAKMQEMAEKAGISRK